MHSIEERAEVLSTMLSTARQIALYNPTSAAGQAAWEYLQFCVRHGYIGSPTDSSGICRAGTYLQPNREGFPKTPEEAYQALGIIVYFSDEKVPSKLIQKVTSEGVVVRTGAYVSEVHRVLVIGYADWHTPVELALNFLHEVRHARHYFGGPFEDLPPLDPDEYHESRTWKYELDLLDACGGEGWQQAVARELAWLIPHYAAQHRSPGEKFCAWSDQKHPELDGLFGTPIGPDVEGLRGKLVAMRANFRLAELARLPDLDQAYANIVGAFYAWSKKV